MKMRSYEKQKIKANFKLPLHQIFHTCRLLVYQKVDIKYLLIVYSF